MNEQPKTITFVSEAEQLVQGNGHGAVSASEQHSGGEYQRDGSPEGNGQATVSVEELLPWWGGELEALPSSPELQREKILQLARTRFERSQDWIVFFRDVLGPDGLVRAVFKDDALDEFQKCQQFQAIQEMVAHLRKKPGKPDEHEPSRVITVRLPESVHTSLSHEAERRNTSVNKLCISKLLQMIDPQFVPADRKPKEKPEETAEESR